MGHNPWRDFIVAIQNNMRPFDRYPRDKAYPKELRIENRPLYRYCIRANYVPFWFRRLRSGMPVVKNVDKITEMMEVGNHISSRSIA
ncbi:hypothetical protein TNCV_3660731 [Trichonephila clavipes]|nr:hypothetical protein TNCV_3660731 [Trichonephila clavipes]